jgi:GTP-binding protein
MTETLNVAAGEWLFARGAAFERGVSAPDHLPPADRVEVALCGRSNVGKSSLLNALTGRRALARVSHTPGRTRELNFFRLPAEGIGLYLVDLPGYGHAEAPKKRIAAWNALMTDYLRGRPTLRRVFLLIDARHGIKKADHPFFAAFDESAVSYQIVLTKCDKVGAEELASRRAETEDALRAHPAAHPALIESSSVTGHGIPQMRAQIASLIDLSPLGYKGA